MARQAQPGFAGRKKGSLNRDKKIVRDAIDEMGFDLIEGLVNFAKGDFKSLGCRQPFPPDLRLKAMIELMKYSYPQLKHIDGTVKATVEDRPYGNMSNEELDKQ